MKVGQLRSLKMNMHIIHTKKVVIRVLSMVLVMFDLT